MDDIKVPEGVLKDVDYLISAAREEADAYKEEHIDAARSSLVRSLEVALYAARGTSTPANLPQPAESIGEAIEAYQSACLAEFHEPGKAYTTHAYAALSATIQAEIAKATTYWQDEAKRYAENAVYWRGQARPQVATSVEDAIDEFDGACSAHRGADFPYTYQTAREKLESAIAADKQKAVSATIQTNADHVAEIGARVAAEMDELKKRAEAAERREEQLKAQLAALTEMDEATAAGNGTLHGAVDHWQQRAEAAERERDELRAAVKDAKYVVGGLPASRAGTDLYDRLCTALGESNG